MFFIIKSLKYLRNYFYVFLLLLNSVSRNSGSRLRYAGKSHLDNSNNDFVTFAIQQNLSKGYLRPVENYSVKNIARRIGIDTVPSCEKLRAMWIFSRRRARGTEITNEISVFHDSLNYNMPSNTLQRFPGLYGMPQHRSVGFKEPITDNAFLLPLHGYNNLPREMRYTQFPENKLNGVKNKFNDLVNLHIPHYILEIPAKSNTIANPSRRFTTSTSGSFQKLKELIWTERVKDQIRKNNPEDALAKAFALRNIINGHE